MKEDLIRLKNSFDTGKRYSQYIGGEGSIFDSLSKEQIISRDDSEKVVVYVEELFEKAICNLSSNNILFNKVSVNPVFSIFVDDDFLDKNGEIVDYENGIIKDYVGIVLQPVMAFDDNGSVDFVGDFDYNNAPVFFTKFSDFVLKLNECGYELDGISCFGDICNKISNDENVFGEIGICFEKEISSCK